MTSKGLKVPAPIFNRRAPNFLLFCIELIYKSIIYLKPKSLAQYLAMQNTLYKFAPSHLTY